MKINGFYTKEIKDFDGLYRISEDGKLYRYKKTSDSWKQIGNQNNQGYIHANLSITKNKIRKTRYVLIHRLVAEAFLPNEEGKNEVDHINEDKSDNRVENLRFVSKKENIKLYNTTDGRDYHSKLRKRHSEKIKKILSKIRQEKEIVLKIEQRAQNIINKLDEEMMKFNLHIEKEEEKLKIQYDNYKGYKTNIGKKYSSVDDMVKETGKSIIVDGKQFISCGSAAQYIVDNTEGKNKATISKELRRYLQGKRNKWKLYDKFTIGY